MTTASGYVEVEGGRLYHERAGSGPAVVLIHPGLWDLRAWDAQFDVFAERHEVVRYDVRGYGRSSRPEAGRPYSHIRDLAAVMDAVAIERAALVGCSLGGGISIEFSLVHPDRTSALVLAAPGLGGLEGTPDEEAWWEPRDRQIEAAIAAGDLERAQDLQLAIWASLGVDDESGRRIREIAFDNLHELTMDESGKEGLDPPAIGRLEEIAAPALVLPADHDPPGMRRLCEVLAARIPGARTVEIPVTDHVINMRRPAEFNRVVLAFLAEV